jgi:hypothetical protein
METITSRREQVRSKFLSLLEEYPSGRRFSDLIDQLKIAFPEFPLGTLTGNVWNLDSVMPETVGKYSRGVWVLKKYMNQTLEADIAKAEISSPKIKEQDFYESVKNFLVTELQECTTALALGGNIFKDKWGTPDVIGVNRPKPSDVLKFQEEIISVEVKTDTSTLITAFGQACSYKLFSHKTYIAIPDKSPVDDVERLESLCLVIGIGLILFDNSNPAMPRFKIRCRALRTEPDMFYVNRNIRLIADELLQ